MVNYKMPNLKASESEKYSNDKAWFKDCMNYIKPTTSLGSVYIKDFSNKLANYRLLNSDIRWEDIKNYCDPLGLTEELFEEDILPFNVIPKVINELIGEELKRNDNYKPVLVTQQALGHKDEEFNKQLDDYIESQIQLALSVHEIKDEEQSKKKMKEILDRVKPFKGFQATKEILASNIIEYGEYDNNLKALKSECWKDKLLTDEEIVYIGVEKNKPIIKHVNPLFFTYHKSSEQMYINKGDWAGTTIPYTYMDVLNMWGDVLSEKDLENLKIKSPEQTGIFNKSIIYEDNTNRVSVDDYFYSNINSYLFDNIGTYGTGNTVQRFYNNFVWVTHLEWKAFKEIGFLTYIDEYGEEVTEQVSTDFIPPSHAIKTKFINRFNSESEKFVWDKYSLEWILIPRVYEGTRISGISGDSNGIFVNLREKPFQTLSLESPYDSCNLSYTGRCYSSSNTKSLPTIDRMKPLNILYIIAMNHLVKLIARNKGTLINIDTSQNDFDLSETKDAAEAMEIRLKYMDLGYNIYNSSKLGKETVNGLSRPAPSVDNADTTAAIINVLRLLEWLNTEIAMVIGVSPQRMAQMVSDRVSDNQQALIQSSYITEPLFFNHNETWKEINLQYLRVFIIWLKEWFENNSNKKHFFLNYNFSAQELKTVQIENNILEESDYGLRMLLSGDTKKYYEMLESLSLAFVQNDQMTFSDISKLLLASIGGTSPHELSAIIEESQTKRLEQQEQMEIRKQEMMKEIEEQKIATQKEVQEKLEEMEELKHKREMEKIRLEGDIKKEIAVIKTYEFTEDLDQDDNGIPDPIEAGKLQHQINKDQRDSDYKERELELKQQQLKLAQKSEENEMKKHKDNTRIKSQKKTN